MQKLLALSLMGLLLLSVGPLNLTKSYAVDPFIFLVKWGSWCIIDSGDGCVDPDGLGPFELGDGQFYNPFGIATDSSGNVYVADSLNNRIQKFSSTGAFLTKWGSAGTGNGQFSFPSGVATDSSGNVYVVDSYNHRIQKFSSTGAFLTQWGSAGTGNGQLHFPFSVATDSSGSVYVADTDNGLIQKFSSTGAFLTQWDSGDPIGVATDSSGSVYVADQHNHLIQKFSSTGAILTAWGSGCIIDSGDGCVDPDGPGPLELGDGEFYFPSGVATDFSGNVYVADSFNNRIQKFSSTGAFLTKWGSTGSGDGNFYLPFSIATDLSGNVYVADSYHNRIQKFGPTTCSPPISGEWFITSSCTITGNIIAPDNVHVENGAVVTIENGGSLNIDFTTKFLMVHSGSSVLVKSGGKIF